MMEVKVSGNRFSMRDRSRSLYASDRAALFQVAIAGEYDHLLQRVSPGETVIDCGANIGVFSVIAAKAVGPSGRVFAIEPEPDNLRQLRLNIQLNALDNVTVLPYAVDAYNLSDVGFSGDGVFGHLDKTGSTRVNTATLSSIVKNSNIGNIAALKVDIEGGEVHALSPAAIAGVLEIVREVAVEVHSWDAYYFVRERLIAGGFSVSRLSDERAFVLKIVSGVAEHPILTARMYRLEGLGVCRRLLKPRRGDSQAEQNGGLASLMYATRTQPVRD